MDAKTARTLNIRRWVAAAGGPAEFADKYGGGRWVAAQVSQWISETSPKGIGHKLARDIEMKLGQPAGAMDRPPSEITDSSPTSQTGRIDPEILAASIKLIRLCFKALEVEHDQEQDGVPTALAYAYLYKRKQRAVSADNVVDFIAVLKARQQGAVDGQRDGGVGEGDSPEGRQRRTR